MAHLKANFRWLKWWLLAAILAGGVAAARQNLLAAGPSIGHWRAPAFGGPPKKGTEKPEIRGTVLHRPNGGYLGLTFDHHRFVLSFYNSKKKPVKADVALARAWWPLGTPRVRFTPLKPDAGGTALMSPKVNPPDGYKMRLFLYKGASDTYPVEHYTFFF